MFNDEWRQDEKLTDLLYNFPSGSIKEECRWQYTINPMYLVSWTTFAKGFKKKEKIFYLNVLSSPALVMRKTLLLTAKWVSSTCLISCDINLTACKMLRKTFNLTHLTISKSKFYPPRVNVFFHIRKAMSNKVKKLQIWRHFRVAIKL